MAATVMWFRRDLRLTDNPALLSAAAEGAVVPLFVVDPRLWAGAGPARRAYLGRSLQALDASLRERGGFLVVRHGGPTLVVPRVAAEVGAHTVHVSADCTPYGRQRDARVAAALADGDVRLAATGSPYAVTPGRLRTGQGAPYRVFTPYFRAWLAHGWRAPAAPDQRLEWLPVDTEPWPDEPAINGLVLPAAGEVAARRQWQEFRHGGLDAYDADRDRPDLDATSHISAHLKFGELHPRTLLADLAGRPSAGAAAWRRQLAWREFFADVLWHNPQSAWNNLRAETGRAELGRMPDDDGAAADRLFEAWAEGHTGYPFVDAGMRQLASVGWMHNRVRLVVASFLTKDLHLDWRRGARLFNDRLVDGDLASNNHSWQWVAGTGVDAAPYHRILNPVTQGKRYDPDGNYIRRWVPELRTIDGSALHEPWLLTDDMTHGYPARIIDHDHERRETLHRYERSRR